MEEVKVEAGIEGVFYAINTGDENKPEFLKDENGKVMKFKTELGAGLAISAANLEYAAVVERKQYVFSEEYNEAMKKLEKEAAEA